MKPHIDHTTPHSRPRNQAFAVLLSLLLLLSFPADGADRPATLPNDTLREVQVQALRRMKDAGVQQTTLDTTVLHQNVALSMSDILTQHSSLFIKSYGRATESTAEFRGTSPSHTQVLWNGIKINSPMLGTLDFSTIPAYFVDDATLLHGASSLTLTGGGLGGAVDLRTIAPATDGWAMQYIQGWGSFETYDQFLRLTYRDRRWSSSTRVAYSKSQNNFSYTNYDKKVDERDEDGRLLRSYHPTEHNRSGYFEDINALQEFFYHDDSGNRLSLQTWYTHSLRGLPFLSVDYRDDTSFTNEQKQDHLRAVATWNHTRTDWSLQAQGGYTYQDIAYDYTASHASFSQDITHSRSRSHQGFLQATADWMPSRHWLLSAHSLLRYTHVRSSDKSPFHIGDNYDEGRIESALSLSVKFRPSDRLTLSAVVREELYRNDLVPLIPAFFAEYALASSRRGALLLKASVARNYRYPSMDDLYFKPGGNLHLRPERGFTYDGGLEGYYTFPLADGDAARSLTLKGNLALFDSYINDWILWTPNAKGYWQPSNLKRVHNYGAELQLGIDWQLSAQWRLALSGNYAYTPSINKSDDLNISDASYGKQLVYVPRHSANLSARLTWRTWALAYQWHSYSERFTTTSNETSYITGRLKPYYMSRLTAEKHFSWTWADASIKCMINNLLNTEYVTVLSRPMPGRHFEILLEIRPQWKR